jgi:dTDP-4-amino-4,6-dideoxygalactose transaminase
MQINAIKYFDHGALLKCKDKVAVWALAAQHVLKVVEDSAQALGSTLQGLAHRFAWSRCGTQLLSS